MKLTEKELKQLIREELVTESLKRFKVYVSGESKPLILMGKNEKEVKQTAHMMIKNSSVRIRKVVKEGILKEFNKSHFLNLIKQEIESLKGQIAYCKDNLRQPDLKKWIKKEFEAVLKDTMKNLKDTEKHYKRVQKLKEGKLTEDFGMSATQMQPYSSKEAKKIVDDSLRLWAKDVRQSQYRIVKDWMSKAKSGAIDYYDLVRGLKTGDISRAHPYETKFLFSILNKDKVMKRFYSYFGGKKSMNNRLVKKSKR